MKKLLIGVMGPGSDATTEEIGHAYELGALIAEQGWGILTGGSNAGVMNAALQGAKERRSDCVTIGILSHRGEKDKTSEYADYLMPTGMGEGRNYLNIVTSNIIVSCCNNPWTSPGTMSEIFFTIKHKKPFVGLHYPEDNRFYRDQYNKILQELPEEYRHEKQLIASAPENVIATIKSWLK